jgi:signal transduction histidine kinase
MDNTCTILTEGIRTIAAYSHLVPVVFMVFLGVYSVAKTRYSKAAVVFLMFTLAVSLWLLGDLVLWVIPDYYYVVFFWSWLDYVNVVFFALGAYFFAILARDHVSVYEKVAILVICLPAFVLTATGNAVVGFEQVWCEATENTMITYYKLFAEWVFVSMIFVSFFIAWKSALREKKIQIIIMLVAILLFFATFSVTEYIAVNTGIYEINLYSLFILPLFLIIITFSITNLGIFNIRYLGTQLLVYILILMVGSQFLFLQDSTDLTLNVITLVISIFIGITLLQNAKREFEQKRLVEQLATDLAGANARLERLDKMKSEFVSIASHQLRSPLTSIRGYVSMILEGSYGTIDDKTKEVLTRVNDSARNMALSIDDFLNVSRIEAGNMKYDLVDADIRQLVENIVADMQPVSVERGIPLDLKVTFEGPALSKTDVGKSRQIIQNLIDNAFKYNKGNAAIEVSVRKDEEGKKVHVEVKDQGIGLSKESLENLFGKFARANNASSTNVSGSGLGLYIARTMAREMGGDITVTSPGEGQGSTFTASFPLNGIVSQWTKSA